jgi:NifU-like protein
VAVYPKKVQLRAFAIQNTVARDVVAASGRSASFVCGCYVSFALKSDEERVAATFASNGCGYMIAVADIFAEMVSGKGFSELHGLDRAALLDSVEREIDVLPSEREHCAEVCFEALRTAFAELRAMRIEEFRGEEALVCTCFGISESVIEEFIAQNQDVSLASVADSCRAGSGCGSCRMLIQEMIDISTA